MMMDDFSDKIVVVNGAAGNLGGAVAKAFKGAGSKLVLVDRSADHLQKLFPDLVDSPNYYLATCSDLTNKEDVEAIIHESMERFQRIDILVNTVGGYRGGDPLHETSLETWNFMLDLNALTIFIACQCVIPIMLKQSAGKIINISARAGLEGNANLAAYSASKSAAIRLTESMAAELRYKNINVNCVLPGTIDTPQNRQSMPDSKFENWVKPESLADVILFLASNAARDVNGAAVPVYGKS